MTSILLDFLTLGTVRERFDTLSIDRPPQVSKTTRSRKLNAFRAEHLINSFAY